MPAKSKSQQRLFGIVHAIQNGEAKKGKFSKKIVEMAKRMDPESVRHFASTKTDDLPEKKASFLDKSFALGFVSAFSERLSHAGRSPNRASTT